MSWVNGVAGERETLEGWVVLQELDERAFYSWVGRHDRKPVTDDVSEV
jgi:hypothetical protein